MTTGNDQIKYKDGLDKTFISESPYKILNIVFDDYYEIV